MPVYDQSYRHWKGSFRRSPLRWAPMVSYHMKHLMRSKLVWFFLLGAFAPALGAIIFVYVGYLEGPEVLSRAVDVLLIDSLGESATRDDEYRIMARYGMLSMLVFPQSFVVLSITSIVGSGLIAKDIRSNALEIYLTKPITPTDYILGKLAVIAIFIFLVTFAPAALVLLVASSLWEGFGAAALSVTPALFLACAITALVNGSVILGLSSLTKSSRYATVIWFAICFVSQATASALQEITREPMWQVISYRQNFALIIAEIMGSTELPNVVVSDPPHMGIPIALLGFATLTAILVLRRTIRAVENA
ncbi:MAG: ABC transporter permease subunit [Planctomycetota bacterium]